MAEATGAAAGRAESQPGLALDEQHAACPGGGQVVRDAHADGAPAQDHDIGVSGTVHPAMLRRAPGRITLRLMRRILLWFAGNRWLRERIPRLWFARRAVRRFMPGEDVDSALTAAVAFRADGIGSLFTRLGENVTDVGEADVVAEHYLAVIGEIAARGLDGEVSVKLTQLGFDLDLERTLGHA